MWPVHCAKKSAPAGKVIMEPKIQLRKPKLKLQIFGQVNVCDEAIWYWKDFDLSLCKLSLQASISINIVKVPFRLQSTTKDREREKLQLPVV